MTGGFDTLWFDSTSKKKTAREIDSSHLSFGRECLKRLGEKNRGTMGIVNEPGRSPDGMRSSWSFDADDVRIYLDHIWLVEDGDRVRIQLSRPIRDKVLLAIPTGAKKVVFFKSSRGNRLVYASDEKYLPGIDQAGITAKVEQRRLQEELDARIHAEYRIRIDAQDKRVSNIKQDNPLIDAFEVMSGLFVDRRYTGNTAYGRAVAWGEMGCHPVVSVVFKQEQKCQYRKFPVLTTRWSSKQRAMIDVIPDAIALLDEYVATSDDILEAIEVAKEC